MLLSHRQGVTKHDDALRKAMPLICRAAVDVQCKLYAAGDESGAELSPVQRDEMLAKLASGAFVAVDADILAYEQRDGVSNRNFVRFRNESLIAMAKTGVGRPFLKDHEQYDSMAVAGKVLSSSTTKLADGEYVMRQRVRLTAPWAVDLALRDLLSAVSIGWEPTGPVMCSVDNAPIFTKCYHWPGDQVTETPQLDGSKKYLRDRNGALTVEWIYTKADLLETSMCPIGGVKMAGFEGVRAALSAAGVVIPDEESTEARSVLAPAIDKSTEAAAMSQPVLKMSEPTPTVAPAVIVLTDAQHAHYKTLAPADQVAFLAMSSTQRESAVAAALAADAPIWTGEITKVAVRKSDGPLVLQLAQANEDRAKEQAAMATTLATERAARARDTLRSRAATLLAGMHGSNEVHDAILGAVDGIADVTLRAAALASLDAWRNGGKAKIAPGVNPGDSPTEITALAAWNADVADFAKANAITDLGLAAERFLGTPEGKTSKAAYDAQSARERVKQSS